MADDCICGCAQHWHSDQGTCENTKTDTHFQKSCGCPGYSTRYRALTFKGTVDEFGQWLKSVDAICDLFSDIKVKSMIDNPHIVMYEL